MIELKISTSKNDQFGLTPFLRCPYCGQGYVDVTPDCLMLQTMSVDCACDNCKKPFHIFRRPVPHHSVEPIPEEPITEEA